MVLRSEDVELMDENRGLDLWLNATEAMRETEKDVRRSAKTVFSATALGTPTQTPDLRG